MPKPSGTQPQTPPQQPKPAPKAVDIDTLTRSWVQTLALGDAGDLIRAIEQKRGSRVLCLMYSDLGTVPVAFAPDILGPLEDVLRSLGKVPKLDVFLRSIGGAAEIPWRIVSMLREFCDELGVIVADKALSGGCHVAIAADELILTPFSVLGSVDPARRHELLPKDNAGNSLAYSVQDLKHCIQFIQEQLGDSYSNQNLALIISELFKYVNPLAIGALEQAYNLARLITRKVLETHVEPLEPEIVTKIVDQLSGQYFSHSFLISRAEVEADLRLPVTKPDDELLAMITNLQTYYTDQFKKRVTISNMELC